MLDGEWGSGPEGREQESDPAPRRDPTETGGRINQRSTAYTSPLPPLASAVCSSLPQWVEEQVASVPSLSPLCRSAGTSLHRACESSVTPLRSPKGRGCHLVERKNVTHGTFQETPAPLKPGGFHHGRPWRAGCGQSRGVSLAAPLAHSKGGRWCFEGRSKGLQASPYSVTVPGEPPEPPFCAPVSLPVARQGSPPSYGWEPQRASNGSLFRPLPTRALHGTKVLVSPFCPQVSGHCVSTGQVFSFMVCVCVTAHSTQARGTVAGPLPHPVSVHHPLAPVDQLPPACNVFSLHSRVTAPSAQVQSPANTAGGGLGPSVCVCVCVCVCV